MLFIAIGANLQSFDSFGHARPPIATCIAAIEQLYSRTGLALHAVSAWYRSAPVPPSGQPAYINGVAALAGDPDPVELLGRLHEIEAAFGRTRTIANDARTLDLDIIDINGMVRDRPDPVLPHPRAHLRAFVLYPLRDIAPNWMHPATKKSIDRLIAALPPQQIERLIA